VSHLTDDLLAFIRAWLPPPPARVLEVGCGDGALTRLLAQAGFDVTGLDPEAPEGEGFVRGSLEDFRADAPFDAAVAIRSLHHVHDLPRALDSLRAALRPEARLVLFEFAAEHYDDDARRWAAEHGIEPKWNLEHVIPLAELRAALGERFQLLLDEPAAYLALEAGREDLATIEEAAIERGELRAAGALLVYERR
jgi:SAM-dependent methyltransferase